MIRAAPEANEADLKLILLGSSFRRMKERCLAVMLGQGQAVGAWSRMQGQGLKQDAGEGLKQNGEPDTDALQGEVSEADRYWL